MNHGATAVMENRRRDSWKDTGYRDSVWRSYDGGKPPDFLTIGF